MITVLIADDEENVSQLIKALIRWDELDLQFLGSVNNGETEFDVICKQNPDIVITDIRMPEMDGLEVIRKARELNLDTKFIVVSGYRLFEYAQNAIRYGVEDFLLKPINQTELNNVLEKIIDQKQQLQKQQNDQEQIQSVLEKSRNILYDELLQKLLQHAPETEDVQETNRQYHLNFKDTYYQAIVLQLDQTRKDIEYKNQDTFVLNKLIEIAETSLAPITQEKIILKSNPSIICVLNLNSEPDGAVSKEYSKLFGVLQNYVLGFEQYALTMGVGFAVTGMKNSGDSIVSAINAVRCRVILGSDKTINASEYHPAPAGSVRNIVDCYKSEMVNAIECFDEEKLNSVISEMFRALNAIQATDGDVFLKIHDQIITVLSEMVPQFEKQTADLKLDLEEIGSRNFSIKEIELFLKEKLRTFLRSCKEFQLSQINKPIRDAKLYIGQNYGEKVTLENIADYVNLNAVYFSVLFKKETGLNFSSYLLNVRMNAAKEFLRTGNDTIAAIAEKVGYKDAKHFSQVFSKAVGIKPAMYRKIYS